MKRSSGGIGRRAVVLAALVLTLTFPPLIQAQDYPSRPIRMVVPFSPGGAADTPGRMLMQKLSEVLGQQVIVDNRPGAGGTIGAETVARATPDGYTLLLISNTHVISASLYKNLAYDAIADFTPVLQFGDAPNVLLVNPKLPAKSVQELIALAKANPGSINYASSGNGSSQHLFAALFASMAGINMFHIPYKGSARATTELLSGEVKVGCPGIAGMMQYIKDGRLRPLAVTGAKRSPELPDVPTIAEAGVKGYQASLWLGILGPKGLPKDISAKLNAAVSGLLKRPDVQASLRKVGTEIVYRTPEEFGKYLGAEHQKWAKVVKDIGLKVN
ncbi:MAG: Bug family tripartite tricarboxylate transporter substrate binding protein [Syntrophales bacterium]